MVVINKQSGQAVLIILLVMAVILTIALSVVSRSVTDISISRKEEEAARAFSAAEAGIERALKGIVASDSLSSGGSFSVISSQLVAGGTEYAYPATIVSGESATVWFVSHDASGNLSCSGLACTNGSPQTLTVCWGASGTDASRADTPAIEVSVIFVDNGNYKIARKAYDPNATRRANNSFDTVMGGCTPNIEGQNFAFSKAINLETDMNISSTVLGNAGGLQLARIKLFYNTGTAHPVGVKISSGTLPSQGQVIESTGWSSADTKDSTRKIEANQLYSDLPSVFDFGLFSGSGNLVK